MEFSEVQKQALCQWSPDSRHLAAAAQNRVLLRDAETLSLVNVYTCGDKVERIEWSADSEYILSEISKQGVVQVWSVADPAWTCRIDEGLGGIARAAWGPSSRHVLVVSEFQLYLSVWTLEVAPTEQPSSIHIRHPKFVRRGLAFSRNNRWMALLRRVSCRDSVAVHACEGQFAQLAEFHVDGDCADLAWAPGDRALVLWERPTKESRFRWFSPRGELLAQATDAGLLRSAWASPSALFLVAGGFDGRLHLVSGTAMKTLACFTHDLKACIAEAGETGMAVLQEELVGGGAVAQHLHSQGALMPQVLAAGRPLGSVRYVPVSNPASLQVPEERTPEPALDADGVPRQGVGSASWSPDERYVATRHDGMPTAVWVWDLGRLALAALLLHRSQVRSLSWDTSAAATGERCRLAVSTADSCLFFWSPVEAAATPCPLAHSRLLWRRDGRSLLLQERDRACVCWPGAPPVEVRAAASGESGSA